MKPFNLERFLAGDKVTCRDGTEVKQLTYFPEATTDAYTLRAVVNKAILCWTSIGERTVAHAGSKDLVMAPKTETYYYRFYKQANSKPTCSNLLADVNNIQLFDDRWDMYESFKWVGPVQSFEVEE